MFVADVAGEFTVSLVVNDGFEDSDPCNITVVVLSFEDATVIILREIQDTINLMPPDVFKNKNMRNALTNKLNAVLDKIDRGIYGEAYNQLLHDILKKTNGCAGTGAPDKNDWIRTCEEQEYSMYSARIRIRRLSPRMNT